MKWKILLRYLLLITIFLFFLALTCLFLLNYNVIAASKSNIKSPNDLTKSDQMDCILVLGCGIWGDQPSPMLRDRLDTGIALYHAKVAPKLLMSGDHGRETYNEVGIMKQYAIDAGVPSTDIFMDHAGFSTHESLYRVRDIFSVTRLIVVTQEYHLYRALYIAKHLGLTAYGVPADPRDYAGQTMRECREIIARCKDSVFLFLGLNQSYMGDVIPISGNGDITNDTP